MYHIWNIMALITIPRGASNIHTVIFYQLTVALKHSSIHIAKPRASSGRIVQKRNTIQLAHKLKKLPHWTKTFISPDYIYSTYKEREANTVLCNELRHRKENGETKS